MELPENIKKLVIVPDGNISVIPFEVLLEKPAESGTAYNEMPFLIKNHQISYGFSANLHHQTQAESSAGVQEKGFVGMAPVFSEKEEASIGDEAQNALNQLDKAAGSNSESESQIASLGKLVGTSGKITPIPQTAAEVNEIDSLFKKNSFHTKTLYYKDAAEQPIKDGLLKPYRYVHIATHGFVNSDKPELSGFLLAQTGGSQDGILFSREIYNLELNADLTVLSACETGLGKITKGEGVIGLSRALFYAGTQNLIVSLWKVADRSTAELMVDFYDYLLHHTEHGKAEALQKAKVDMINGKKFAAPYYWSPFILIGE